MDTGSDLRITRKPRMFRGKPPLRWWWVGLLLVFSGLLHAAPQDEGLLLRHDGGEWMPAATLDTSVHFDIHGLLAEVEVKQSFNNDSDQWMEGRYLLPLPETGAVHDLRIEVDGRVIVGEIQEKQEARRTYEAAASNGQRAALVEQNRPNLFQTRVANVGPGERVDVTISYAQRVDFSDGKFSLTLPLTLTPRYESSLCIESETGCDSHAESLPARGNAQRIASGLQPTVSIAIDLDPGLSILGMDSPTHALTVQQTGERYHADLKDAVVDSDRDFVVEWRPVAKAQAQSALFHERIDGEDYALMMLMPPTQPVDPLPRELVVLIDTSGSMTGTSIEQARAAVLDALDHLHPDDRFNLIRFESRTESLFESSQAVTTQNLSIARSWVETLQADGGTELAPALTAAFSAPPESGLLRQVVLITDAAIGDERMLLQQIETQLGPARLFPVGIGSAPNGYFLREAARLGRGSDVLIRSIDEVGESVGRLFDKLDRPALRDLDLNWPTGAEAYPQRLPDLYSGEPLLSVAKLPVMQGELKASGWNRKSEWSNRMDLSQAGKTQDLGVARLWARARIDSLEDQLRQGASEDQVKPEIVDVSIRHRLVSRFTSLVAVDRTPVRQRDESMTSVRFDNATPDGSLAFAQTGTGARSRFALAVALLLVALAIGRSRRLPILL